MHIMTLYRYQLKSDILLLIIFLSFSNFVIAGSQINSTTTSSSTNNVGYGYQTLNAIEVGAGNNSAFGYQALKRSEIS